MATTPGVAVASDNTVARTLHDLGAAGWFGGALMGTVGLQGPSSAVKSNVERVGVSDAGWQKWKPWEAASIATHVAGSLSLLWGNKGRLAGQRRAMTINIVKVGAFGAALDADVYAVELGRRIGEQQPAPVDSALEPSAETSEEFKAAQRQLQVMQWAVPAVIGLNIALGAKMGEQPRLTNVVSGLVKRLDPRN